MRKCIRIFHLVNTSIDRNEVRTESRMMAMIFDCAALKGRRRLAARTTGGSFQTSDGASTMNRIFIKDIHNFMTNNNNNNLLPSYYHHGYDYYCMNIIIIIITILIIKKMNGARQNCPPDDVEAYEGRQNDPRC